MTRQALVGVDVGTTSIKALCVGLDGRVLGSASQPTPWRHDGPLGRCAVDSGQSSRAGGGVQGFDGIL